MSEYPPLFLVACLASYLLGSIPFGWVLVKLVKGVDIRTLGSGNIGATNVGRAVGKWAAIVVYLLDFAKGFAPTFWGVRVFELDPTKSWIPVLLGSLTVIGHCFPIYLKFKGGKGVATTTGVLLALEPLAICLAGGVWFVSLVLFRYVAVASILLGLSLPFFVYFSDPKTALNDRLAVTIFSSAIALFIVFTHRQNIRRLSEGTEPKIGSSKNKT